ncbi:Protein DOWN-REGULATED IN DIF1 11 [Camellia lanceoleosa]|uniref:Protein DOWN-REGULATED IN DIF1 11 n=1 Tax=Camellia lanceoleosa TaxID=1840588 RepID=A0ACC0IXY9_9ERIC|nr:Protein DOWN-REGULATED IN DIF1 11 [Camellia lanceoleosa]
MTKLTIFLAMLIMYIAIKPSMEENIAPQPANNGEEALAPSPMDDFLEDFAALAPSPTDAFLEKCVENFNETCGSEIFEGIFINTTVTAPCCKNLVAMGKECHGRLVNRILEMPWIRRHVNVPQVLSHSDEIWSKCVSDGVVVSSASSPSSF